MKALFLDRDGILNEVVIRSNLPSSPRKLDELRIFPQAIELVKLAKKLGFITIVITNQPDVSRKLMSRYQLEKIHQILKKAMPLDRIEVCTSAHEDHYRRKPNPGMILESAKRWGLDLSESLLIGDSSKDLEAGRRAGLKTILLETDYNRSIHGTGDINCRSLTEVLSIIRKENRCSFKTTCLRQLKSLRESIQKTFHRWCSY